MRIGWLAVVLITAPVLSGCGGGGGGSVDIPPSAIWGQFRQDGQRTGAGFGFTSDNDIIVDMEIVDEISLENPRPSAISSSPAVDSEGNVYIGTEGGTLASFEGDDELDRLWTVNRCAACPAGNDRLGALISSPAVYMFDNRNNERETNLVVGSKEDAVFLFRAFGHHPVVEDDDCDVCFWRGDPVLRRSILNGEDAEEVRAEFLSSPTFTINLGTGSIAGIFIGARITIEHEDGSTETLGKLYAINNDGSLRWEFPRIGQPRIGPVTSSPTFALGNTLYFTSDADPNDPNSETVLYGVTEGGNLKRSVSIKGLSDPTMLLSPTVVSGSTLFLGTVEGTIHAMNPDGTFRWNVRLPDQRFISSLVVGNQNEPTETPEPDGTHTPTPTPGNPLVTITPTVTQTPLRLNSTLIGVTESGMLVVIDSSNGRLISPTGEEPLASVQGTVVASPALSADLFVAYGTTGGQLFNVNTANGQFPRFCSGGNDDGNLCTDDVDCDDGFCESTAWPLFLPKSCRDGENKSELCESDDECPGSTCERPAIRSSPSMDLNGTIYFGADDGRIYAVGAAGNHTPTETQPTTPTNTPPPSATGGPPTATATPTIELTATATSALVPTPSPTDSPTQELPPTGTPSMSPTPVEP